MTVTSDTNRLPIYDRRGQVIATTGKTRSSWLGILLAECSLGHVYLLEDDMTGCPVCQQKGLE